METLEPRSQFYGRRTSRRLTGTRIDALRSTLEKYEVTLPLPALPRPLRLEIGFGAGEHLLAQAKAHPGISFIGCEPYLSGVSALVRALEADAVRNVRIYPDDARMLLRALPTGCVERVHVLFADPWPKLRHNRRRMIGPETLDMLDRILTQDGDLYLATDHAGLAEWYRAAVLAHPAFTLDSAHPEGAQVSPAWTQTRYEAKALAAGGDPGTSGSRDEVGRLVER